MNKKIGFIGCGNMAKAMITSIIKAALVDPANIFASDGYQAGLDDARSRLGINTTMDNKEVVNECDVIFLAVKPNIYDSVMKEIAPLKFCL